MRVHASTRTATKGETTRQRVIAQAAPVLNTKGFAGTALSDLMSATGLQKGGIYRHFASKEELALATLRHTLAESRRVKFDGIDPAADGFDQLKAFIHNFVHQRGPVAGGCPVLNCSSEHDDGLPTLRREAQRAVSQWQSRLAKMVRLSQQSGTLKLHANPRTLALYILSTLEGALALQRLTPHSRALWKCQPILEAWLETFRQ